MPELGNFVNVYPAEENRRICSHCGNVISEGYVFDGGTAYYCSDECACHHFSSEDWLKMLEESDGDDSPYPEMAYWTDF